MRPLKLAVIALVPTVRPVANPLLPLTLLTAATEGTAEAQLASLVMSRVLLSENVAVAVSCFVSPVFKRGVTGVNAIETNVVAVTVKLLEPETAPLVALMLLEPTKRAITNPLEPAALLTPATLLFVEAQVTCVVKSCTVLSVKVPVAVICLVNP